MAWRPIASDRRAELEQLTRELAAAIATVPAATPADLAVRAVLGSYLAAEDVVPDPDDLAAVALTRASAALAQPRELALFSGATAIAWSIAHLAGPETAQVVCSVFDAATAHELARSTGDFDLLGGAVGSGIYALELGEAGRALAIRVLDHLERRARPRCGGAAWHTPPELLPDWPRALAPAGYWNLGLAHGSPGVIALLARFVSAGIEPARAQRLLDDAVAALLAAMPARADGRYPSWQAGGSEERQPAEQGTPSGRLAWCYNDL